ncbi:MAG: hypothetical protein A2855_01515 [Candidatus Liptonbacteria bacterium RIFCSPHIGHO2_01_FULL_57_28]|uniref:Uncharacterized protein n=1 Tax=Candidatus Liptonbacteria bacterium RIFCSPHIGHO2_01_FULL_57_28 TaxID=1798647 RepID=A0A1G2CBD0_9BACT|nr:MAG: hypothetical protein A2855_01515 [Candidatus Liptonbacteria bacterium RIFCSPHIGHO2_01_FULL_57_28]
MSGKLLTFPDRRPEPVLFRRRDFRDVLADTVAWPVGAAFNARASWYDGERLYTAAFVALIGFAFLALAAAAVDSLSPAILIYAAGSLLNADAVKKFRGYFLFPPREEP